jgi:vacuolar-type H+-ATPase subunit F/Vma7
MAASLDPVVVQLGGEGGGDLRDKVRRAIGIDLYKE